MIKLLSFKLQLWLIVLTLLLVGCGTIARVEPEAIPTETSVVGGDAVAQLEVNLTVEEVQPLVVAGEFVVVDVRTEAEYDAGHIPAALLIPLTELPDRIAEIPADKPVLLVCRSGNRSSQSYQYLREQGFTNIHNLLGGMNAWGGAGYETEQ